MRIGIDISQLAYRNTGVANYLKNLLASLSEVDKTNEYILFFSSLRGHLNYEDIPEAQNFKLKKVPIPASFLSFLWNTLHIFPIERFTGPIDLLLTSDWTEPPVKKAKKVTILYDLIVYTHPEESTDTIISTQKKKLKWVVKESQKILCISEATLRDAEKYLGIEKHRLEVVYPGVTL